MNEFRYLNYLRGASIDGYVENEKQYLNTEIRHKLQSKLAGQISTKPIGLTLTETNIGFIINQCEKEKGELKIYKYNKYECNFEDSFKVCSNLSLLSNF